MIKEKKKNKLSKKQELKKELMGYLRTMSISFCIGVAIASLLSLHARSEMIKNLYASKEEKSKIEKRVAKEIIAHSDLISELSAKNYSMCMRVGNLYETAGDYQKAEYAYYLATQKTPDGTYTSYYRLAVVLIAQDKIEDAEEIVSSVQDISNLNLIKFKTRACITIGDKYYSVNKFLKAANYYEKANYYYNRLDKKDKYVEKAIHKRLINSYLEAAGVIIKNGYASDAIRFLNKALKYDPNNYKIKYRIALVYADTDPIKALEYFEHLIEKIPQEIDYNAYNRALMKAANIEDLQGNGIKAKYYRYKVHSLDLFINQKVVYKDDLNIITNGFNYKKVFFKYKLKSDFVFQNLSASDINKMSVEFVLRQGDKEKESTTFDCVDKKHPLLSNGGKTDVLTVIFGKNIFTKKELNSYSIDVYAYKDKHFKTLLGTYNITTENN